MSLFVGKLYGSIVVVILLSGMAVVILMAGIRLSCSTYIAIGARQASDHTTKIFVA